MENNIDQAVQMASAGGAVAAKATAGQLLGAIGGCTTLGTILVMAMTFPNNKRDFLCALISSVTSSFAGGIWFSLHYRTWEQLLVAQSDVEMVFALLGVAVPFLVAALPGWIVVRSFFVYAEARKTMSLLDMILEVKNIFARST